MGPSQESGSHASRHSGRVFSRPLFAWLGVLSSGLFAIVAAATSERLFVREVTREPIVVDPADLDLGTVWASDQSPHRIRLRNVSAEPLEVRINSTCGCTSITPSTLRLRPGGEEPVDIVYDSLNYLGVFDLHGTKSVTIQLLGTLRKRLGPPLAWSLRGLARKAMNTEPPVVSFGELSGSDIPPAQEVRLLPLVDIEHVRVSAAPSWLHAEVTSHSQLDLRLRLEPMTPPPVGELADVVVLEVTTGNDPPPPPVRVPVVASVEFGVVALPAAIYIGSLPVGSSAQETITIQGRTGSPFSVLGFSRGADGIKVRRAASAELASSSHADVQFDVCVHVGKPGMFRSETWFDVEDVVARQRHRIVVPIVWRGEEIGAALHQDKD